MMDWKAYAHQLAGNSLDPSTKVGAVIVSGGYAVIHASNKLTKEDFENLDELSKKTLSSYIKKGDEDYDKLDKKHRESNGKKYTKDTQTIERKMVNRTNGNFNANQRIKKMAKKD